MKGLAKKITFGVTVLFFAAMLFLTFFAESIHNASLPRVTVSRVESRLFSEEYIAEDGSVYNVSSEKSAVSEEMLNNGIFTLYTEVKNGTKRNCVSRIYVETGRISEDGYYEIVSGLDFTDRIVTAAEGELYDGCEVFVSE